MVAGAHATQRARSARGMDRGGVLTTHPRRTRPLMRISVEHSTVYRYDAAVHQEPHTFRLTPRSDASQRVLRPELAITPPPAGRSVALDLARNVVTEASFLEPMTQPARRGA